MVSMPRRKNFLTHGFLHRNWVETVGYFVPPYFSSDFNDTWLNEVADMIGRKIYSRKSAYRTHAPSGREALLGPDPSREIWRGTGLDNCPISEPLERKQRRGREDAEKLNQFIKDNE